MLWNLHVVCRLPNNCCSRGSQVQQSLPFAKLSMCLFDLLQLTGTGSLWPSSLSRWQRALFHRGMYRPPGHRNTIEATLLRFTCASLAPVSLPPPRGTHWTTRYRVYEGSGLQTFPRDIGQDVSLIRPESTRTREGGMSEQKSCQLPTTLAFLSTTGMPRRFGGGHSGHASTSCYLQRE